MPSMYDSEEEDEDFCVTDTRDENICNDRQRNELSCRYSRFSLMRCLAWSQTEDDNEDEGVSEREEEKVGEEIFMLRNNSGGIVSFNSIHSALVDSVNHVSDNRIRPVHWDEQVPLDKKLDSFLPEKKTDTSFS